MENYKFAFKAERIARMRTEMNLIRYRLQVLERELTEAEQELLNEIRKIHPNAVGIATDPSSNIPVGTLLDSNGNPIQDSGQDNGQDEKKIEFLENQV
ncbi:MAG: hypothetical protein QXO21_00070 [Candidatus Anstonellales archaeon]